MINKYFNFEEINKALLAKLVILHLAIIALSNWAVQFGGTLPFTDLQFTWGMFTFPFIVVATEIGRAHV